MNFIRGIFRDQIASYFNNTSGTWGKATHWADLL
jgi:hypothetical protein